MDPEIKNHLMNADITEINYSNIERSEVSNIIKGTSNWNAPCINKLQNIWMKKITILIDSLIECCYQILKENEEIPGWFTMEETTLTKQKIPANTDQSRTSPQCIKY